MSDNIISIIDLNSNLDETYERLKPKKHSIYWNVLDCYSVQDYKPITNNALLIRMLEPIRGNKCYDLDIKNINLYKEVVCIRCDDIEKQIQEKTILFNNNHAKQIQTTLYNNYDEIVVHCSAGISRSAGVMLAVAEYLNDTEMIDYINKCGFYMPNRYITKVLLNTLNKEVE